MSAQYVLSDLTKTYAERSVLNIADLSIQSGEILALVGPSGAGKSTLLRLLNFLEFADEGQLIFDQQVVTPDLPLAQRRRVTMVFQSPALLKRSVLGNLKYGLQLRGETASKAELLAHLDQVGLADLAQQPATKLSAGEAQRLALARALVVKPDVLLLDEPTANLDPYNVGLIEDILQKNNAARGTTVVLITHNVFQAQRIAQRTGLLVNGKLVEIAPTALFFEAPVEQATRDFVAGKLVY